MTTNREISDILDLLGDLMELDGVNKFRIIAIRNAARRVAEANFSIEATAAEARLTSIPDVGEKIAAKIVEFIDTGRLREIDEFLKTYPADLVEVMRLQGVGPRTARKLWEELEVSSLDDLETAALADRISPLPGMGKKSQSNILSAIVRGRQRSTRLLLGDVLPLAEEMVATLHTLPETIKVAYAGSVRRMKETVKDLDIIATAQHPAALTGHFANLPLVAEVIGQGPTKCSIRTHTGLQIDLRVVPQALYGNLLQHFTGSREHNVALRELAISKGMKVSEYGVEESGTDVMHECSTEVEVYQLLGLGFIPPELREDNGELQAAADGSLPELIVPGDLKGDLHVHSEWSDGNASIRNMALAARQRGHKYIAISDHSQSMGMVRGLTPERLKSQLEEINRVNEDNALGGFHVFSSVELDVRSDGALDFPDDILAELDFVTVSIHSGFNQSQDQIMARLRAAMENPYVRSIGHPTGRLINRREPYQVDIGELIDMAARTGTALEINSHYYRLDLKDTHTRAAQDAGVRLVINSDAHQTAGLDMLRYGIATARRGWVRKETVLNTLPLGRLRALLSRPKIPAKGKR